jgi:predicted DNA binding protein
LPEIKKLRISHIQEISFPELDQLTPEKISPAVISKTRAFIKTLNKIYIRIYNNANDNKDNLIRDLQKTASDKDSFLELKRNYHNEKLTEFVENNNELIRIIEYRGRLYQKVDPIYLDPEHSFIKAHFYAPRKMLFGKYYKTFWVNTLIIWCFSLILYILLYFRLLKRFLDRLEQLFSKRFNQV